ncbi:hypothetical protein SVAN01_05737 [Stagonosporopsis vannaccii]|nr:hypothetical protein SVAN01_05737 [Stagonosporopsis vannaccii]
MPLAAHPLAPVQRQGARVTHAEALLLCRNASQAAGEYTDLAARCNTFPRPQQPLLHKSMITKHKADIVPEQKWSPTWCHSRACIAMHRHASNNKQMPQAIRTRALQDVSAVSRAHLGVNGAKVLRWICISRSQSLVGSDDNLKTAGMDQGPAILQSTSFSRRVLAQHFQNRTRRVQLIPLGSRASTNRMGWWVPVVLANRDYLLGGNVFQMFATNRDEGFRYPVELLGHYGSTLHLKAKLEAVFTAVNDAVFSSSTARMTLANEAIAGLIDVASVGANMLSQ